MATEGLHTIDVLQCIDQPITPNTNIYGVKKIIGEKQDQNAFQYDAVPGEGVCLGGCLPGRCLPRGWVVSAKGACTPPPVNRITDRCKNITFPQLPLRTVTRKLKKDYNV